MDKVETGQKKMPRKKTNLRNRKESTGICVKTRGKISQRAILQNEKGLKRVNLSAAVDSAVFGDIHHFLFLFC